MEETPWYILCPTLSLRSVLSLSSWVGLGGYPYPPASYIHYEDIFYTPQCQILIADWQPTEIRKSFSEKHTPPARDTTGQWDNLIFSLKFPPFTSGFFASLQSMSYGIYIPILRIIERHEKLQELEKRLKNAVWPISSRFLYFFHQNTLLLYH